MKVITTAPSERRTTLEFNDAELLRLEAALHVYLNRSPAPLGAYDLWDEVDDVRIELGLDSIRL